MAVLPNHGRSAYQFRLNTGNPASPIQSAGLRIRRDEGAGLIHEPDLRRTGWAIVRAPEADRHSGETLIISTLHPAAVGSPVSWCWSAQARSGALWTGQSPRHARAGTVRCAGREFSFAGSA